MHLGSWDRVRLLAPLQRGYGQVNIKMTSDINGLSKSLILLALRKMFLQAVRRPSSCGLRQRGVSRKALSIYKKPFFNNEEPVESTGLITMTL